MPEPLLNVLKYFLIALIWLFFIRVLRAVWIEMKAKSPEQAPAKRPAVPVGAGAAAPSPPPRRSPSVRLEIVSGAGDGQSFELGDELTVGRSPQCGVALEHDTYASKLHARVYRSDGRLWVEDLGSTNGTYVNSDRVRSPKRIAEGDQIQVGETVLEVAG